MTEIFHGDFIVISISLNQFYDLVFNNCIAFIGSDLPLSVDGHMPKGHEDIIVFVYPVRFMFILFAFGNSFIYSNVDMPLINLVNGFTLSFPGLDSQRRGQ